MTKAACPEILAELAVCILNCLTELPDEQAKRLSLEITEGIRVRFGGELVYIPKGDAFLRERRDMAIVAEFNGSNHRELARRYRLGVAAIYDVLKRSR